MEPPHIAAGDKAKARDLIAAIRTLKTIEHDGRLATVEERNALARFPSFGSIALSIFPDPVTGRFKDGWKELGDELQSLLTPEEYASAKRTVFNAFYTSPLVIRAIHDAMIRMGVPQNGLVLEPGCGTGNFMSYAPQDMRFIGVELDDISGRIAKARFPQQDIRVEDFQTTRLPQLDGVCGNVPFADVRLEYQGERLPLHDYFLQKSLDALAPGGCMAIVSTHFTLDKQNAASRERIAEKADFVGAIRLPSDAFKREGTAVVTDLLCFRKRAPGEPARHVDPDWLKTATKVIDGREVSVNRYFLNHPEQVLGDWSIQDTLHGATGYSLKSNGDLPVQLHEAIARLPRFAARPSATAADHSPLFVPPPTEPHLSEGSFFVANGYICQLVGGRPEKVTYGGAELTPRGGLVGRRMAALIGLHDIARRVLQSQNQGWPAELRAESRRDLNRAYDAFVSQFGPINKTTFTETKDGSYVRRMPNVTLWKQDPDAMLVLALEEYDDTTGRATKSAIFHRDVVGRATGVSKVESAEDGLLISLDEHGRVDLPFIATLYGKPEEAVIDELGDLIYRDPTTGQWETADSYLAGNVRQKLKVAEQAGAAFSRNAEALRAVQPEDVLPGDIDAALGSPWVPVEDIQAFAAETFRVAPSSVRIAHLEKDALWSVEGDYEAERSVANTSEFGTGRISGLTLLDQALNLKSPVIYDRQPDDSLVVNQTETMAAKEKQRLLKDRFKAWVFADPERTERLVRVYNDTYNCLRPRLFDGSHLQFSGMTSEVQLRQHQLDGVWRVMSGGNTLLAHVVGAGKTMLMIAAAMKMKQAGLAHKPMFVVPNHMLEQFGREFLQLYPNAKVLIASKDDFTKDRRKFLTAKIASGDWDGVIVTHSSFERIGMSRNFQEKFLRDQIAEYDQLLIDRAKNNHSKANRNILKNIEKQKAAREEKLKQLLASDKKDDGLVFDELGVDHLFIDEAHLFKNLEIATKMDRVAGIQTTGSERAFDLYMKCRYLDEKHAGHGVTFATGTPISNSMVELYTMQRYLDPKGLCDRGIDHFDGWAATFGEVVEAMEIAPDGKSLRPRSRFAKFVNLPELQQMFRAFTDVQTAEMLDLPRPTLKGGKAETVACVMSEDQRQIQDELVERYERLRSQKIDPRVDNALNVTTDGRKLALDARMVSDRAADFDASKINALADNVARIWRETAGKRGTQLVFSDMGVNATSWGFSVYETVKDKLIERGIPREQIAEAGDADSDAKKQALFERVRNGSVRVLLGSTSKMGAGTNVQKRLVALHHLDAPWKPAEIEQREGRILRQGNLNPEVEIYRYVTSGSFDAYMWQTLETKAKFINQVMSGESGVRRAEDISGNELSYAEVKAIASGNPAVLTLADADAELQRLAILRKNHTDEQFLARKNLRDLPGQIERLAARIAAFSADAATMRRHADDRTVIQGRPCSPAEEMAALSAALSRIPGDVSQNRHFPLGVFRGIPFGLERQPGGHASVTFDGQAQRFETLLRESQGPRAVLNALRRMADSHDEVTARLTRDKHVAETQLADYQARHGLPFLHSAYERQLTELRNQLSAALSGQEEGSAQKTTELAEAINQLKASHTVAAAASASQKPNRAAIPVTARARKRATLSRPMDLNESDATALPAPADHQNGLEPIAGDDEPDYTHRERIEAEWRPARQLCLF